MDSSSSYQMKLAQYLKSGLSPKILKKIESMPDALETGRFLYNAGYYKTLLIFSLNNLKKKKQVPWPFVMKTLTNHNITLSKEVSTILLKSLLPKYKEKHPWLSACGEWAEISHEFQALIQSQRKVSQSNPPDTQPTIQTDVTVKSSQHSEQIDSSTLPNFKTTAKTDILSNTIPNSEQVDSSSLYEKKEIQSDITPDSEQSKPAEALTSNTKVPEENKETDDPAVVLLDNPFIGVKTQEDIALNPGTPSKQADRSIPITDKPELPEITSGFNQHSEQMDNSIPLTKQTDSSVLYKKEETQPDITPDSDEQQLLRQLEFVQAKDLIEEEKKIIAILLNKNPEKYKQLDKELKMKEALHFLQKQKSTGREEKTSHWPLAKNVSEKTNLYAIRLCEETVRLTEKHPKKAKDLAIFLYTMGWPDHAIKILEKNIQNISDYWFYLDWLMEIKQHAVVLDMANQLLTKFKPDSETLFPITYIKAQALYALGEKEKAVSYMSDIVKVRPEYKSARHFIEEWTEA